MLALVAWLLVVAFMWLRQLTLSRRTAFTIDWYSLLLLYAFVSYVFPVTTLFASLSFPEGSYVYQFPGAADSALGGMLLLWFLLFSWLGYSVARGERLPDDPVHGSPAPMLIGLVVILGAATIAWIQGFGGFVSAITSVMAIRFGTITADSSAPWFLGLTKAAWFTAVVALDGLLLARRSPPGQRRSGLAQLLMGVSIVALLLIGSRGAIGNVLLAILLFGRLRRSGSQSRASARMGAKSSRRTFLIVVGSSVAIVVLFKPVMTLIAVASTDYTIAEAVQDFQGNVERGTSARGGNLAVVGKVAADFSHFPILSTLAFEDDQMHPEERDYGRDIYLGIAKLLPSTIYEPTGVPLSYRSTNLMLGTWESQIPPGIVAWLLFTGGPLFIGIGSLLCGIFLAACERMTTRALRHRWWRQSGYIGIGITVASGIVGGAPGDTIRQVGTILAVLIVALAVGSLTALLPRKSGRRTRVNGGTGDDARARPLRLNDGTTAPA